jgi:hypothetical protein
VALVSLTPNKFMHPLCWYYRLYEIRYFDFGVATCIPSTSVLQFSSYMYGRTDTISCTCVNFVRGIVQATHNNCKRDNKGAIFWIDKCVYNYQVSAPPLPSSPLLFSTHFICLVSQRSTASSLYCQSLCSSGEYMTETTSFEDPGFHAVQ